MVGRLVRFGQSQRETSGVVEIHVVTVGRDARGRSLASAP